MNKPNALTISRMVIAPLFLLAILPEYRGHFLVAVLLFSFGALTDAIDGRLARKTNQVTVFGKLLDPVADKMLTTAALLAFMKLEWCSVWILMIILTREFAVTSVRLIAASQDVVIPANIFGKIKTAAQMSFSILIMILAHAQEEYRVFDKIRFVQLPQLSNVLLWITAVFAAVSGIIYIIQSKKLIDFKK